MPEQTPVTLCGVVVTAVDTYGGRTGTVYVMDPAGGPFSGVAVYITDPALSAGIAQGDLVDVSGGVKDEFALNSDTSGGTITQIVAPAGGTLRISKVGDGTVPEPELLDSRLLASSTAEAEKWEGVLIKFQDVAVVRAPSPVSTTDNTLTEMTVSGPFRVGAALAALDPAVIRRDDCFAEIVGIGDYFFNYKILPRSAADLTGGGASCPPPEAGELCGDDMDNDADGFADCMDFGCQISEPACFSDTTVVGLQDGSTAANTLISLRGVVVTALDACRKNFWVQDASGAAPNNGIFVFRGGCGSQTVELPPDVVVGAVVSVDGRVVEYDTNRNGASPAELLTEIDQVSSIVVTGDAPPQVLAGLTYATLASDATNEPYEGVLVQLENVRITSVDMENPTRFEVGDAATPLPVGDLNYDMYMPQLGTCLAQLTGVMHRFSTGVSLLPRGPQDIVGDGTCD